MKKTILLKLFKTISLFLLVLSFTQTNAANIPIGNGGTSTGSAFPIYSCYNFNYSQQIVLASEYSATGAAGNITKVRYYYNSGGATLANWQDWTIYLGHTTKTEFTSNTDWVDVATLTQVYTGNITAVAASWVEITFDTPFNYDGVSNLVIAIDENSTGYSCTANWYSYNAGSNRGIRYYSNPTNPDPTAPPTANGGSPSSIIAQIQFEGVAAVCPAPNTIMTNDLQATTATLDWTTGGATSWQVEWDTAGFTQGAGTMVSVMTDDSLALTGLTAVTDYEWYVRDICGADTSVWIGPIAFTTAQYIYTETSGTSNGDTAILYSPAIDLTALTNPTIDFYYQIDNVIIKGNPLEDISHITVVTDDIKRGSQIRNTAELFNDIPGFNIQKRSATASEPSFRCFKYEEMNLKFDGSAKIVHACPNRMDPMTSHLIPEEVQKIEVIKGPYTVRFGQRFGPTINIVTKPPTPENFGINGKVEAGYETNGNNLLARAELMYAHKLFDITLNGESRNFGDYTDGNGTVVPSGFLTNSYSLKAGLNPAPRHRIQLDWRQKFGEDIEHAGLPMDSPKDDSWLLSADYKYDKISDKIRSFSFKAYTSFVDHLMDNADRPNFKRVEAHSPVQSNTYGGKMEFAFIPSEKFLIYTGIDADVISRTGFKNMKIKTNMVGIPFPEPKLIKTSIWQDANIQDYGVFAEASYHINKNLITTVGLRTDYVMSKITTPDQDFLDLYGSVDDKTDVTIGGNIALKYRSKGWQVQFAYGRGTRTPSMTERYIYRFSIGADPRQYIGNPDLKPEVNNQFELFASKKIKKIHTGASIYYSLFEDYITAKVNSSFVSTSGGCGPGANLAPKQFWNVDADQYGFEAFFKYNFYKDLHFSTDFFYTSAYNKTFKEPLAQISPFSTHFSLKWSPKKYWISLRSEYTMKQKQISKTFDESETPAYFLLDLRVGIKPAKNVSIGGAVLNILNQKYYNHLNFSYKNSDINLGKMYEVGRSFSLFAKYQF